MLPTRNQIKRFKEFTNDETVSVYFIDIDPFTKEDGFQRSIEEMTAWCLQKLANGESVFITARPYDREMP